MIIIHRNRHNNNNNNNNNNKNNNNTSKNTNNTTDRRVWGLGALGLGTDLSARWAELTLNRTELKD